MMSLSAFKSPAFCVAWLVLFLWVGSCSSEPLDGGNGTAPAPGPSPAGWQQDYRDDSGQLDCEAEPVDFLASTAARVEVADTTVYVGYEQLGQNQNPIVARFDGEDMVYCVSHEQEGPDARAVSITWNGGDIAYVLYTVAGGGTELEDRGGWLSAYAPGAISGGGPAVSYVGRVDVTNGQLLSGTFIIAVQSDNKVNTHKPAGPLRVRDDGKVEFVGESAHKPIDADGLSSMDCTDYPFDSKYVLSPDLQTLVCAECTNCSSQRPCE